MMRQFVRLAGAPFPAAECWGWKLQANVTMTKDSATKKYKIGDYVILYEAAPGDFKLAFMTQTELKNLFYDPKTRKPSGRNTNNRTGGNESASTVFPNAGMRSTGQAERGRTSPYAERELVGFQEDGSGGMAEALSGYEDAGGEFEDRVDLDEGTGETTRVSPPVFTSFDKEPPTCRISPGNKRR